jgi:hypothetical protein
MGRVLSHEGDRAKVRIDGDGTISRVVGVKAANLVVVAAPGEYRGEAGLEGYNGLDFGDDEERIARCRVAHSRVSGWLLVLGPYRLPLIRCFEQCKITRCEKCQPYALTLPLPATPAATAAATTATAKGATGTEGTPGAPCTSR